MGEIDNNKKTQIKQSQTVINALKEIKGLRWKMTNGGWRVLTAPEATRVTPSVQRSCSERRSAAAGSRQQGAGRGG